MADSIPVSYLANLNSDVYINAAELAAAGANNIQIKIPVTTEVLLTSLIVDGNPVGASITQADVDTGYIIRTLPQSTVFTEGSFKINGYLGDTNGYQAASLNSTIIIDTIAPKAPLLVQITTDANDNGKLTGSELSGNTVNVAVTLPSSIAVGDIIKINDKTIKVDAILVAKVADGDNILNVEFPMPAAGQTLVATATIVDPAKNISPSASDSVAHLGSQITTAPKVTIEADTNDDGYINAKEMLSTKPAELSVSIVLPAGVAKDDTVIVNGSPAVVLTQEMITAGIVYVTIAKPAEGATATVDVTIKDTSDNISALHGTDSAIIDTTIAAPVVSIKTDANNDGIISAPELANSPTITVNVSLPAGTAINDTFSINGGAPIPVTPSMLNSGYTTTLPAPTNGQAVTVNAVITDVAGNSASGSDSAVARLTTFGISHMSKDDGASGSDWITDNGTAGRGVYGTLAAPLTANQKVIVSFDNGCHWKEAAVSDYTWAVTDLNYHSASWTIVTKIIETGAPVYDACGNIINVYDACGNLNPKAFTTISTVSQYVTKDNCAPYAPQLAATGVNLTAGTVTVGIDCTGAVVGDSLHIKWGNDTVDYTLTAADITAKTVTVIIPADVLADTTNNVANVGVSANLVDIAGNVSSSSCVVGYKCGTGYSDKVLTMQDDTVIAGYCDNTFVLKDEAYFTQTTAGINGGNDCGVDILKMNGSDLDLTALTFGRNNLFSKPSFTSVEIIDMSNGENAYKHDKTGLAISGDFEHLGTTGSSNLIYVSKNHSANTPISSTVNNTDVSANNYIWQAAANGLNSFNYAGNGVQGTTDLQIHGQNTVINLDRVASTVSFDVNELQRVTGAHEWVRFFDGNGGYLGQTEINQANNAGWTNISYNAPAGKVIGSFDFVNSGYEHLVVDNVQYTPALAISADTLTLSLNDVLQTGALNQFFSDNRVQLAIKGDSNATGNGDTVYLEKINTELGISDKGEWVLSSKTVNLCKTEGCGYDTYNVYTHTTQQADVLVQQGVSVVL